SQLLAWQDICFIGGVTPRGLNREGDLVLELGGRIRTDNVIALPELRGTRIAGIPASWLGFVPTDSTGRVEGLIDVYAAGDMTTFPVRQGGLATQQADHIAHLIAADLVAPV